MEIRIDVRDDLKRVTKSLSAFAEKQIPFAIAQALNAMGKNVMVAEKSAIKTEFPTATPFTIGGVGQQKARKDRQQTTIYLRDVTATYLAPYIDGGKHHLNSRALLNPKAINLNQYGNIPKNRLAQLRGQASTFIGAVKTKSGIINGVWRRLPAKAARKGQPAQAARLQLLIRFGDALPVKQHLNWADTARAIVAKSFDAEFGKAMAKAIATAKLKP